MGLQDSARKSLFFVIICAAGLLWLLFLNVHPGNAAGESSLIVDTSADNTLVGNGCTLREAIISANNDNAGTSGCDDGEGEDEIVFWPSVSAPITLTSDLPAVLESLTIDGEHLVGGLTVTQTINGNNHQIFYIPSGVTLALKNLILEHGSNAVYGPIYNSQGTLIVDESQLIHNSTSGSGGAIYTYNGTITVTNSTVSHNTSSSSGGAIFLYNGKASIIGSTFDQNSSGGTYDGGAIFNLGANLIIEESTFTNNTARYGGAIMSKRSPITVINSSFLTNTATQEGGAIYIDDTSGSTSVVTVTGSTFYHNHADIGGGFENRAAKAVFITNSTFYSNTATTNGSAIFHSSFGTMTVTHSTIADNGNVSAIEYWLYMALRNTILDNNTNCIGFEDVADLGHNLQFGPDEYSPTCGNSIPFGNPKLGPFANYGGPTKTMKLLFGSAALDQIPSAGGCGVGVYTDQRGHVRPVGSACDIGAFESEFRYVFLPLLKKSQ